MARIAGHIGSHPDLDPMLNAWKGMPGNIFQIRQPGFSLGCVGLSEGIRRDADSGRFLIFDGKADRAIELYQQWGMDFLRHLEGKFALALWDPDSGNWILARDRLGVCPLYYRKDFQGLRFASEPKALLPDQLNLAAVFDYFVRNRVDAGQETLFEGIHCLLPGTLGIWNPATGQWTTQKWYELPFTEETGRWQESQNLRYVSEIRERLIHAVQSRIKEPAATLLSGGIDSSVLAGILRHCLPQARVTALTASFEDRRYGEQDWAALAVEQHQLDWRQVFPRADEFGQYLETLLYQQDTPTLSSGTYLQHRLYDMARQEGLTAVFDGQGADGLFAGHYFHQPLLWSDLLRKGRIGDLGQEKPAYKLWLSTWLKYHILPNLPARVQWSVKRPYFPEWGFLQPDLIRQYRDRLDLDHSNSFDNLNRFLHHSFTGGSTHFLLKCADRAAAWHGVEAVIPYVEDHRLVEMVFAIPGIYKIHQGWKKHLLREAGKPFMTKALYQRKDKMGLVAPNNPWMAANKDRFRAVFEAQDERVFVKKRILAAYDAFFDPRTPVENYRIYKYLSFAVWRSVYRV